MYLEEDLRTIVTRWRMSCVPLEIEAGRFKGLQRSDRLCPFCDTVETESHAIYECIAYDSLRKYNVELLTSHPTTKLLLNPKVKPTAKKVGIFLKQLEKKRKSLVKN